MAYRENDLEWARLELVRIMMRGIMTMPQNSRRAAAIHECLFIMHLWGLEEDDIWLDKKP